ncbi:DUF7007 domain-containing protein [Sphingopyxis panaciterrae]
MSIDAEFGTSADGLMAARIAYLAFIAIPSSGGFRIATAYRPTDPLAEMTANNAYGCEAMVADEAGFRAHVGDALANFRQIEALGRRALDGPAWTPWGASQTATCYAEGIICYTTASHGGFALDEDRNARLPAPLRLADGWYEEDCDWARVATAFPDLFSDREKAAAERTLREWFPGAWEAFYGRPLDRSESFMRDREAFEREHADDWVVIAATGATEHPGVVLAVATLGGRRGDVPTRSFLVPDSEYAMGRHGFVIDPARHRAAA